MIDYSNKSVIIFGGAFNPFHKGHYNVTKLLLKKYNPDYIILLIDKYKSIYYQVEQISYKDKINIIKIFINNEKIIIDDYNYRKNNKYMYMYLKFLKNTYENIDIKLAIGYDQYINFNKWKNYKEIIKNHKIIVVSRGKLFLNNTKLSHYNNIVFLHNRLFNYSSTHIQIGENIKKYNRKVIDYINKNSLFYKIRLKSKLSQYRYQHSINVANLCLKMAKIHNIDEEIAFFIGIYHDYFKESSNIKLLKKYKINKFTPSFAIHGILCSKYIKKEWFIKNNVILSSIANHTIPSLNASKIEKLLYCSDKLCIGRKHNYVEKGRLLLKKNIDKCFQFVLYNNIILLINFNMDFKFNKYYKKLTDIYLNKKQKDEIYGLLNNKY